MPVSEPEICNCAALRQAARRVSKLYDEALGSTGVGLNQYSILARLNRIGPCGIQELAAQLVMDRSTLGRLLRPLEARKLLRLETSVEDRRGRTIALTPAGKALVAQARPLWAAAQERFERNFGKQEALGLRVTLKRIAMASF